MCAFSSVIGQETNIYSGIIGRNAFELTAEKPTPTLPPVAEILRPSIFLTGISRLNGVRKVHLILRKTGESDKFVSLAADEKQYNIELEKILKNSAYISNNGETMLLSFEKNSLPSTITKSTSLSKRIESHRSDKSAKSDTDGSERKRQYDEWRKNRSR